MQRSETAQPPLDVGPDGNLLGRVRTAGENDRSGGTRDTDVVGLLV